VEIIAPKPGAYVYAEATEVVRENKNWCFVAQIAVEILMPGPAGAPGDTNITQMKLSVLQTGGGITRITQDALATIIRAEEPANITQVALGSVIRADEPAWISQVVRATVIHLRKKDFWPMFVHMMKPKQ